MYTLVFEDDFNRDNSATVGNGWVELDPAYEVFVNWIYASGGLSLGAKPPLNGLVRPSNEAMIEGKIRITTPPSYYRAGAAFYDATGGGRGFGFVVKDGGLFRFYHCLNGVSNFYGDWTPIADGFSLPETAGVRDAFTFDFIKRKQIMPPRL